MAGSRSRQGRWAGIAVPQRLGRGLMFLVLLGLGFLVVRVPVPFFILAPGVVKTAAEMVAIEGPVIEPADGQGQFLVTTLAAHPANLGHLFMAALDRDRQVIARNRLLPPGVELDQYMDENRELMRQSQLYAIAAAFEYAGRPAELHGSGAEVRRVLPGMAAAGLVEVGDLIVAVDGEPVVLAPDMDGYMERRGLGRSVSLRIVRDGASRDVMLELRPGIDAGAAAKFLGPELWRPLGLDVWTRDLTLNLLDDTEVTIEAGEIAGPSAGLILALEIVNR
ncbi:MAG: PDZ domain-containing protein, partial [Thermaerobacterales bacterium]